MPLEARWEGYKEIYLGKGILGKGVWRGGGRMARPFGLILLVLLVSTFDIVGRLVKGGKEEWIRRREKMPSHHRKSPKRPPNALLVIASFSCSYRLFSW